MAKQTIDVGATANDGTGDQLRTAFIKTNDNVDEIYAGTASVVRLTAPLNALAGAAGDIAGAVAYIGGVLYVCHTTYEDAATPGTTLIWDEYTVTDIDLAKTASDANTVSTAANLASITSINAGQGTIVELTVPGTSKGAATDLAGMIAYGTGFIYICDTDYTDGSIDIWQKVAVIETAQPW